MNFYWRRFGHDLIIGRIACMGQGISELLNIHKNIYNVQKGRVDYVVDSLENPDVRVRAKKVMPFLKRLDIFPLLIQQEAIDWFQCRPPLFFFMDSYSELTDQMFIHRREGWKFCCNYDDLYHTEEFNNKFESLGLLPVNDLLDQYRRFFRLIRDRFERKIPVIFLHFPAKLDKREKFHVRYRYIIDAIGQIAKEYPPFYSLEVEESIVEWPEEGMDGFEKQPYHMNQLTHETFADLIRATEILGNKLNN